jgi:nucleoside-diphosphate-sugar epimerase
VAVRPDHSSVAEYLKDSEKFGEGLLKGILGPSISMTPNGHGGYTPRLDDPDITSNPSGSGDLFGEILDSLDDPFAGISECYSFAPTTPVLLSDGKTKPIGKVKAGDDVKTGDFLTGKPKGSHRVTAVHINDDTDLLDLTVTTGDGHHSTIHTTGNHPVWDATRHQWVPAGQLKPGERLGTTTHDVVRVAAVHRVAGRAHRWNLTVADLRTYYVMAGGVPVLVHNSSTCGPIYENPGHHDPTGGPNPYNPAKGLHGGGPGDSRHEAARFSEDEPLDPASIYANTKLWGEHQAALTLADRDASYAIVRYFSVYGEPQVIKENSHSWVVAWYGMGAALGLPLHLNGGGSQVRDFVHVEDIADATLLAAIAPSAHRATVNIGTGPATSFREIADLVRRHKTNNPPGGDPDAAATRSRACAICWCATAGPARFRPARAVERDDGTVTGWAREVWPCAEGSRRPVERGSSSRTKPASP